MTIKGKHKPHPLKGKLEIIEVVELQPNKQKSTSTIAWDFGILPSLLGTILKEREMYVWLGYNK